MKLPPDTPLVGAPFIPRNRVANLGRLGLHTLDDLLRHFPRRYEDRRRFESFPHEETAQPALVCGLVVKTGYLPYGRWRRGFEVVLEEEGIGPLGGRLVLRWFNMPYVQRMIATGMRVIVFGRPKQRGKRLVIDHPEFEPIEDDASSPLIHLGRIVPIHPAGEGITPRRMREWIYYALETADLSALRSLVPGDRDTAARAAHLRAAHFPEDEASLRHARSALVFEEFFAMQVVIAARRRTARHLGGASRSCKGRLLDALLANLPFEPTRAQLRAIDEIRSDLAAPHPMHRLLQGDVGSGKTLVALAAALLAIESGSQAAFMAPTQILAEQHYLNFRPLLDPLGLVVALHTGSKRTRGASLPLFEPPSPSSDLPLPAPPHLVVGTHALLYEGAEFQNLGLVIIDEQHKFGVLQRASLIERGDHPDVLVMTATPIPRTLALTAYGDLDVSTLDELPPRRGKIITGIRDTSKLPDATAFLREQISAGRQAYIIYPLVEQSMKLEAKAATEEFEKWRALLDPFPCAVLHGRLSSDEKEAVMRGFREGRTKALIATTVVEVGVDVPNATLMLIENAERFGLAQLHQLRGRVGRGRHTSYCILIPGADTPEAREKLSILEKTTDGFAIAEHDLRLRGPGDLLGTAQTGLPPLKLGDLLRDANIVISARCQAQALFAGDPHLKRPEHAPIREFLENREAPSVASA